MIKLLELFGGIGACSKALERLNIEHEVVDYVEIDKYAVKSYNAIHNSNFEPQDITQWDKDIEVDLIMHGSPCQDFSLAGKQAGGDEGAGTRSSLMYETIRIVSKLKPKYVIWENVKNLLSVKHRHNFDNYLKAMEQLGYSNNYQVLNAKDYGIPQNRERVFTVSIREDTDKDGIEILEIFNFPKKQTLNLKLKDMLEDNVDEKYYLSDKVLKTLQPFGTYNTWEDNQGNINTQCNRACNEDGNSLTIPAAAGLAKVLIKEATKQGYKEAFDGDSVNLEQPNSKTRRGRVGNQVAQTLTTSCNQGIVNNLKIRKLTPKECWRLMGFDDEDFEKASQVNSNAQLYKQAGNSIVVQVLEAIFRELLGGGRFE